MPTRIEVNCETGEVKEIELEGEELAAYEASLAAQAAEAARQVIRDKYAAMQASIDAASTTDEIKAAMP